MTKNQAEILKQEINNLPDFVDLYDHPTDITDPMEPELTNLTVQDDLTQLNNHIDSLLVMKPTLCMTHCSKNHNIQSTPYLDSLFNLKQKILASNSTTCEYLASNDGDIDIFIEVYKSSNPTEKT